MAPTSDMVKLRDVGGVSNAIQGGSLRKLVVPVVLVGGLLATTALPAGAITGDYVEDFEHPFVGAVAFYDE